MQGGKGNDGPWTWNFGVQPCYHGDFLASTLGTGIMKDKLGVILLQGSLMYQAKREFCCIGSGHLTYFVRF
ncbi:RNA-binding protein YlmH [Artemisia annua]|uniref:RNA-binding protein YlmH n=1 Tax=Artemisia annua TaxID=35608 RepID=A0A2U1LFZ9_ARTAN|nr:RNA-binding protein YlmH [Artemisia annua]